MWFKKKVKTEKPDQKVEALVQQTIKEHPLDFAVGVTIKMMEDQPVPCEGELDKLNLEVVDFRRPVIGEFYISNAGIIYVNESINEVNNNLTAGYRSILREKRVTPSEPTTEAFSIPKDMHKADGIPRDCDLAEWNAANLVCLHRPISGGNCPLKCEGDKRSGQSGEIFECDCR